MAENDKEIDGLHSEGDAELDLYEQALAEMKELSEEARHQRVRLSDLIDVVPMRSEGGQQIITRSTKEWRRERIVVPTPDKAA